jgi:hypothetical protein
MVLWAIFSAIIFMVLALWAIGEELGYIREEFTMLNKLLKDEVE